MVDKKILKFSTHKRERSDFMCKILKELQGKTAESLLTKYNILNEPPIDIDLLLKKIGISVVPMNFSPIESEVEIPDGSILGAAVSEGENLSIFYKMDATEKLSRIFQVSTTVMVARLDYLKMPYLKDIDINEA